MSAAYSKNNHANGKERHEEILPLTSKAGWNVSKTKVDGNDIRQITRLATSIIKQSRFRFIVPPHRSSSKRIKEPLSALGTQCASSRRQPPGMASFNKLNKV